MNEKSYINNRIEPLHWPLYYLQRGLSTNFLRDLPYFGLNARCRTDINKQLRSRTKSACEQLWSFYPEEHQFACRCSPIIQKNIGWENDLYIPLDPYCILFWDSSTCMSGEMAMLEIIDGTSSSIELFEGIELLNYVSFLKRLHV